MPAATRDSASRARPKLRLSTRSIVLAVALFGATVVGLRLVSAAERVIGWMLVAVAAAAMLTPLVEWLARRMPRGLAIALVMLTTVLGGIFVTRALVSDVARETKRLQTAAPEAAARLEDSRRVGGLARAIEAEERTRRFVDGVPNLLTGPGTRAEKLRAAATRGVAALTTTMLTLFLLLHGPRIVRGGLRQIRDATRRARAESALRAGYRRGVGYAGGTAGMAALAGVVAYALAWWADVPGAGALGVWMALWDIVPIIGAVVGAAPIVVLAAAVGSPTTAALLAVAFLAYQVGEALFLQRPLEARTVRVGPFLTLAAALVGLEVRGVSGALLAVLAVAVSAAVIADLAPADQPSR